MSTVASELPHDGISTTDPSVLTRAQAWRVVLASSLGTMFEWYDFFIYGSLAVIFGARFFPEGSETAAFLASLATFGAGFAVRPLGGILFGAVGDMIGRKISFLATIVLMGISTAAIGFLPTFETWGWAAPVALVGFRLLQGLALGGESGPVSTSRSTRHISGVVPGRVGSKRQQVSVCWLRWSSSSFAACR